MSSVRRFFFFFFLNLLKSLERRQICNTEKFSSTQTSQEVVEMKKEKSPASSTDKERKDLVSKLSRLSIDNNVFEGSTDLPQVFQVYICIYFTMFIHAHSRSSRLTLHHVTLNPQFPNFLLLLPKTMDSSYTMLEIRAIIIT